MGCNLAMTYALDCHPELSGELMITVSVLKSVLAWAWTWFINDWIVLNGMMMVYFLGERINAAHVIMVLGNERYPNNLIVALISTAVYATTILFYYKGKNYRIWIQEKNFLGRTGLA